MARPRRRFSTKISKPRAIRGGPPRVRLSAKGRRAKSLPIRNCAAFAEKSSASSFGSGSDKLVGSLTSVKFKVPKLYLHARIAGSKEPQKGDKARLRLTIVADSHKSLHVVPDGNPDFQWKTDAVDERDRADLLF